MKNVQNKITYLIQMEKKVKSVHRVMPPSIFIYETLKMRYFLEF